MVYRDKDLPVGGTDNLFIDVFILNIKYYINIKY